VLQVLDNLPTSRGSIDGDLKEKLSSSQDWIEYGSDLEEQLKPLVNSGKVVKDKYKNYESKAHLEKKKQATAKRTDNTR